MADRKARSLTFKIPRGRNLGLIKQATEHESSNNEIKVFQEICANEYLIEHGFDADFIHIRWHPLHGYCLHVSIVGLKAYISDIKADLMNSVFLHLHNPRIALANVGWY